MNRVTKLSLSNAAAFDPTACLDLHRQLESLYSITKAGTILSAQLDRPSTDASSVVLNLLISHKYKATPTEVVATITATFLKTEVTLKGSIPTSDLLIDALAKWSLEETP